MVTTTVDHGHSHASASPVKNESGFSVKAWLFGRREEPESGPADPDDQSTWVVEQVRAELRKAVNFLAAQKRVAASPTDLDGSRPAYLLRHIGMLALDLEIDPDLSFRDARDRLQSAWDLLNERADEQGTVETRTAAAMAAGRRVTQKLTEAAATEDMIERVTGERVKLEIDTAAIGEGLARLHVNAHRPQDETMQFPEPLYTPGMPDPRTNGSAPVEVTQVLAPLHPWDAVNGDGVIRSDGGAPSVSAAPAEVQPAVPHEPSPQASKLPRRRRVTSFSAAMSADPGVPLDGAQHEAVDLEVMPGAWLLDGGAWRLVSAVVLDAEAQSVVVTLADETEIPPFGHDAPVWLLGADVAARMALAAGTEAHR